MATVTLVTLTCDVCGNATDVQTQTIGLDGKTFEIDLCPKDSKRLSQAVAGYVSKARKGAARHRSGRNARKPRSRAGAAAGAGSAGKAGRKKPAAQRAAEPAPGSRQDKGIYVYGILPADIEMAADMPGIGESPGLLRVVRRDGLAALISEVDLAGRLGSPEDLQAHADILDATATEVPVVPLRCGVVLASEDAVAEELLEAHHDTFAHALEQLEGRAEFVVKARYLPEAVLGEVVSENKQAARLQDKIQGKDAGAVQDAGSELGEIISDGITARQEEATRAVRQAMDGHCVASVVREPTHELDAAHVAFLVEADREHDVERVIARLARDWEGRIEVQLLGPMAAYDFVPTAGPEASST